MMAMQEIPILEDKERFLLHRTTVMFKAGMWLAYQLVNINNQYHFGKDLTPMEWFNLAREHIGDLPHTRHVMLREKPKRKRRTKKKQLNSAEMPGKDKVLRQA